MAGSAKPQSNCEVGVDQTEVGLVYPSSCEIRMLINTLRPRGIDCALRK
jgi:hypothetical protein